MRRPIQAVILTGAACSMAGMSLAADFDFSGTFTTDDQVELINFTVGSASRVTIFTSSWGTDNADDGYVPNGGFDPLLGVWDSDGTLVDFQDAGLNVGVTQSNGVGYSHGLYDVYLTVDLTAGDYVASLTQYSNFPLSDQLADGFVEAGNPNFTFDLGFGGKPMFNGVWVPGLDPRTGAWVLHIINVTPPSPPNDCGDWLGTQIGAGKCIENGVMTVDAANQVIAGKLDVGDGGGMLDSAGMTANISGEIVGNGPVRKVGAGRISLTARNSYRGRTFVDEGTLSVDGSLAAGGVTVNPSGTLRGTGVINGDGDIRGRLAPGGSPGTLTFNGPVVMRSDSVLQIDIDGTGTGNGAGNYSRLIVQGAGNTFTAGGDFQPLLRGITGEATNAYTPPIGQQFVPVVADGGIVGTFDSLTKPDGRAAGTRFDLLYDPTRIRAVVTPASYAHLPNMVLPGNAMAVGGALNLIRPAPAARKDALFRALAVLDAPRLALVLPQLAGEIHADMIAASFDVHRAPRGLVFGRLEDLRLGRTTPSTGVDGGASSQARVVDGAETDRNFWLQATGKRIETDGDEKAGAFDEDIYTVAGGGDLQVLHDLRLGGAVAYGHAEVDAGASGEGDISSLQLIAYGLWERGQWFANAAVGYGWDNYDTKRVVDFPIASNLSSRTDGNSAFLDLEVGLMSLWRGYLIEPSFGMRSDILERDEVAERGLGGLVVRGDSWQALQTRLGARFSRDLTTGSNTLVTPELRLHWLHDFGDSIAPNSKAIMDSAAFSVQSPHAGRDALEAGAGVRVSSGENLSFYIDYKYTHRSAQSGHGLIAGFQLAW
ncbi:DVUA0089 family protein [Thiohalocapsa sp. ML1]|uniref:autotransporter outer membrane beta-barrel domain-containing protein n=1 Tax=Thiohalocapsa sp. ML1 TaxID=1431688 RepID=UPI000731F1F1|nr:DVUA0089 family protein [Thiohalocapsa sp. ML1]